MGKYISEAVARLAKERGRLVGGIEPCAELKGLGWQVYQADGELVACAVDYSGTVHCGEKITKDELPLYVDDLVADMQKTQSHAPGACHAARYSVAGVLAAADLPLKDYRTWIEDRGPLGPGASPERIYFAGWFAARRAEHAAGPADCFGIRYVDPSDGQIAWDYCWADREIANERINDMVQSYVDAGEKPPAFELVPLRALTKPEQPA